MEPGAPVNEVIREASGEQDYQAIAALITEYVAWLRSRYAQDAGFINEVLDKQSLSSELENLSTMYGSPNGRALLAVCNNEVRGCGAYRRLADGTCEMKRVYVPVRFQGAGLGRRICNALVASARADGFHLMKLDTGSLMKEALAMYRSLGFKECPPYHEYPEKLMPYLVFMELPLAGVTADSQ
jgi:ribosomal protein S18 acetylase RimI-like enzyme